MFALLFLACQPEVDVENDEHPDAIQPVTAPTWHGEVAPILGHHCTACHAEGESAAFLPLDDYEEASAWSMAIAVATTPEPEGTIRMPPFRAAESDDCRFVVPVKHPNALSDEAIATLRLWADAGAPLGDPNASAPIPAAIDADLEGAFLYLNTNDYAVPASPGGDHSVCYVVDPGLDEPAYPTGMQLLPDDRRIVHHANVFIDTHGENREFLGVDSLVAHGDTWFDCTDTRPHGEMAGAYVPGAPPIVTPAGSAFEVLPDSLYIISMHYYYLGDDSSEPRIDNTSFSVQYADPSTSEDQPDILHILTPGNFSSPPAEPDGTGILIEPGEVEPYFLVPPHTQGHKEVMRYRLPGQPTDEVPYAITGIHMHGHGTHGVLRNLTTGDCIVQTPKWDFDWQMPYTFEEPMTVHGQDLFELTCTFDNDTDEPVIYNLNSDGEMCSFFLGVVEE